MTIVHKRIVAKIEETDLTDSFIKQVYIKTLRGNLEVGAVDIRTFAELYDPITSVNDNVQLTYKEFISRYIKESIYKTLTRAGYDEVESIINTEEFNEELHMVLLAADWACEAEFCTTVYFHILPVELRHPRPVNLFIQSGQDDDEFTYDGITYSVLPDSRYSLTPEMIGKFQASINKTRSRVLNLHCI